MNFVVELSPTAEADLERLFDLLLDQADTTEDLDRAQAAIDAIRATVQHRLAITPFSFRKAAQNPGSSSCPRVFECGPVRRCAQAVGRCRYRPRGLPSTCPPS